MFIWFMFLVYIILSIYMMWRIIRWTKKVIPFFRYKRMQAVIVLVYLCFASTLIWGGLLPKGNFQTAMQKLGNYWLGVFIYMLMNILILGIVSRILKRVHKKYPIPIVMDNRGRYIAGVIVILSSVFFSTYGFLHFNDIKTTKYHITVEKGAGDMESLQIALVADLHLGYNVGCRQMRQMVERINSQDVDLVVIAGDIFDNDYDALEDEQELISIFRSIKSRYGVYAVYGNHDVTEKLIGGFSVASKKNAFRDVRMEQFLGECHIHVLSDEVLSVAQDRIYLAGRRDRQKAGDGTSDRKSIQELVQNLDSSKLLIVIDHQPSNLSEIAAAGADVMLCGHTHAGQFFPLTLVQPFAWQNYYGCEKINKMYSVVTSGVGVYGPAMRVLTDSEVVFLTVDFAQ